MPTTAFDWTLASYAPTAFQDYTYPNGANPGDPQRKWSATGPAMAIRFRGTGGTVLSVVGTSSCVSASIDGGPPVDISGVTFGATVSLPFAAGLADGWHVAVLSCTTAYGYAVFRRADAFAITGAAPAVGPCPLALADIRYDHESSFFQDAAGTVPATAAGQPVKCVTNAASPGTFDLSTTSGGYTLGVDGAGNRFIVADGSQSAPLEVASSGPLDALFASGWTAFWAGSATTTTNAFLLSKGAASSGAYPILSLAVNISRGGWQGGSLGNLPGRPFAANTYTSLAQTDELGSASHYRDGLTIYQDGAACGKAKDVSGTFTAGQASHPLCVGGLLGTDPDGYAGPFAGAIKAVAIWRGISYPNNDVTGTNPAPWSRGHHETLAVDRHYRGVFGGPETLTGQVAAVVVDSSSESVVNLGSGPGPFDVAVADAGIGVSACFMLGQSSRTTSDILADYPTWAHPLIAYLGTLGMRVAYHLWEGINDGYVEPHNAAVMALAAADGAYPSISTAIPRDPALTPAATIESYNASLVSDAAANGWQVARLDQETHIGFPAFVSNGNALPPAYYADGTHWNYAGQAYGGPPIGAAILASLPPTAAAAVRRRPASPYRSRSNPRRR